MNKAEKFEIFRKLDALFSYSELLPDEFKSNFIYDLDDVRKKISTHKCEIEGIAKPVIQASVENIETESPKLSGLSAISKPFVDQKQKTEQNTFSSIPFSFKPLTEEEKAKQKEEQEHEGNDKSFVKGTKSLSFPPPPPPTPLNVSAFTNYKKAGTASLPVLKENDEKKNAPTKEKSNIQIEPIIKKNSFEAITSSLIPKLSDSGKKLMGDLSVPIESYLALKTVDGKNNLYKLFENYNKKHSGSFVEFANTLYALELERNISFIKTEATVRDLGIIKIEELLLFGKVVTETAMTKGAEHQKIKSIPFIGKALVDLKYLTENSLGLCMKIQKWVSRTVEKAEYINLKEDEVVNEIPIPVIEKPLGTGPLQLPTNSKLLNMPPAFSPPVKEVKPNIPIFDFIIPVFNQKGLDILQSDEHQALANRIKIIDGQTSVLNNYWSNRDNFKKNILAFIKFLIKLDSQEILNYKDNDSYEEKIIWIRFGELLISLGLITVAKINQAFEYSEENDCYIGEAISKLGFIEQEQVEDLLKIQNWLNNVLSKVSYERVFVDAIQSVLKSAFKCNVDIGALRKVAFQKPLKDTVYIKYNISGKLNGRVFYISDKAFMQQLANTLMNSVGNNSGEFDETYVATVCTVIISNSLSKLSQMGLFSSSEIPKIIMEKEVIIQDEVVVADYNKISMIPLINDFGRFAIGLEISDLS